MRRANTDVLTFTSRMENREIEMIENALIQFKGANGVLRIDLSKDERWQKLAKEKGVGMDVN